MQVTEPVYVRVVVNNKGYLLRKDDTLHIDFRGNDLVINCSCLKDGDQLNFTCFNPISHESNFTETYHKFIDKKGEPEVNTSWSDSG